MQTLQTLIFTVKVDPDDGSATLTTQLVGTFLGVSGEVTESELETLIAYLAANAAKIRQVKTQSEQEKEK